LFHIRVKLGSLTLQEEYRLIAFANRAPKKTFGRKRAKVQKVGKKLHNDELIICTTHQILLG